MINAAGSEVGRFLRRDVLAFRNQISLRALAFLLNAVLHVVDEFLLQLGVPLVAPPDQRVFNLPGTFRDDFFACRALSVMIFLTIRSLSL